MRPVFTASALLGSRCAFRRAACTDGPLTAAGFPTVLQPVWRRPISVARNAFNAKGVGNGTTPSSSLNKFMCCNRAMLPGNASWGEGPSKLIALTRAAFTRRRMSTKNRSEAAVELGPAVSLESSGVATTRPVVGYWLLGNAALVFGIVVIGGLTRLTESGLSIVEWKPVTGVLPPRTQRDWEEEFEKYKNFPEYILLNKDMSLPEFKSIFYMEWAHRIWGRVIGLAFFIPAVVFMRKGYMTSEMKKVVCGLGALIAFQGILGWFMVRSGLEHSIIENKKVPRVSQYRLAAHLGTVVLLYIGMVAMGLRILRTAQPLSHAARAISSNDRVRRYRHLVHVAAVMTFLTAISGAFVAGLDAGLVYNEFPLMGGHLVPEDIWSDCYATTKSEDGKGVGMWRNIFENPTTVQFNHRVLAIATAVTMAAVFAVSRRTPLTPRSRLLTNLLAVAAAGQVTLGILTLLHGVPIPLAAAHQAGSLTLLTAALGLLHELKYAPK